MWAALCFLNLRHDKPCTSIPSSTTGATAGQNGPESSGRNIRGNVGIPFWANLRLTNHLSGGTGNTEHKDSPGAKQAVPYGVVSFYPPVVTLVLFYLGVLC